MSDDFQPLKDGIISSFTEIKDNPCFIHSDLFKIGIPVRKKIDKNFLGALYADLLINTCKKGLIIPTFNYDFCSIGTYDVTKSPSQVGLLSEYFRQHYPTHRTIDPIFNAITINYEYSGSGDQIAFGDKSIFSSLVDSNAFVCFLGAGFESNTFIHFVEEFNKVGYRYIKQFTGEVITASGQRSQVKLNYRVRPKFENSCNYRWNFLEDELTRKGILCKKKINNGRLLYFKATDVLNFWNEKLKADELYFLNEESRKVSENLFKQYSHPLPNLENLNL